MRVDDLDYHLPEALIAQRPTDRRDAARLLLARPPFTTPSHHTVSDLPDLLAPGDLLIFNDTRVLPARFHAIRDKTGGRLEGLFIEARSDDTWHVLLRSGGRLQTGEHLTLQGSDRLHLLDHLPDGSWIVRKISDTDTITLLQRIGSMPLPPYIRRQRHEPADQAFDTIDRERYQTVYARQFGAVAAPTAGLHFTPDLLDRLRQRGIDTAFVTLHVGLGTFQPVRVEDLDDHPMHSEHFTIPAATLAALIAARNTGRRIIAVGTTSVRAIESLPQNLDQLDLSRDFEADTALLIQPGFNFRFTRGLMTNFHLPRSTLLALVAAITGLDPLKRLYTIAIENRYRFYSYGDAMLLLPH
jgi:S-adenosylmethionine:tRNA ribosyltransferase-isomerase